MTRRVLLSYLTIALFVLITLEVPLGISFARSEFDRLALGVERDAVVIGSLVVEAMKAENVEVVDPGIADYALRTGARVVIVNGQGTSVYDSASGVAEGRDFSTRPEVQAALRGERSVGQRRSETLDQDILYVAVPIASGGQLHGAVRLTFPTDGLDARIRRNWLLLTFVGIVVLTVTTVIGSAIASWVTRPTRALGETVARLANGDLDARADVDDGPPEVRDLARRFNSMADRISELITAQRSFVSDASHQLRTPLTALRLELEDLASESYDPSGLERAIAETQRLSRLVEGLLALARGEGRRAEPVREDVGVLVRERRDAWRNLADEVDVALVVEAPRSVLVWSVPGALAQVLDNLVANALDVSTAGDTIRIRVDPGTEVVAIHVEDEGPGMPPEHREHAFDRFWRGADAEPGSGSGLGLPIARQLVRLADGDLTLEEAMTGGIDAVVRLRAAPRRRYVGERLGYPIRTPAGGISR